MGQRDQLDSAVRGTLAEFFNQSRLARATELALSRRYDEAVVLLAPEGRSPANPKELDLLARIAAQRWRFAEAERLWLEASRLAPEGEAYRLAAAQAARSRQVWRQAKQMLWAVLIGVILAGLVLATIDLLTSNSAKPARPNPEKAAPANPAPKP